MLLIENWLVSFSHKHTHSENDLEQSGLDFQALHTSSSIA